MLHLAWHSIETHQSAVNHLDLRGLLQRWTVEKEEAVPASSPPLLGRLLHAFVAGRLHHHRQHRQSCDVLSTHEANQARRVHRDEQPHNPNGSSPVRSLPG